MITSKRSHDVTRSQRPGGVVVVADNRSNFGIDRGRSSNPGFRRNTTSQFGSNQRASHAATLPCPPPPIVRPSAGSSFAPLELQKLSRGGARSCPTEDDDKLTAADVRNKTKAWVISKKAPSTSTKSTTDEPFQSPSAPEPLPSSPPLPTLPLSPNDTNRPPPTLEDRKPLRPLRPFRKRGCGTQQLKKASKEEDGAPVATAEAESLGDYPASTTAVPPASSPGMGDDTEGSELGAVTSATEDDVDRICTWTSTSSIPVPGVSNPCGTSNLPLAIFRHNTSTSIPFQADVVSVRDEIPLTPQDYAALADFVQLQSEGPDDVTGVQKAESIRRLAIQSGYQQDLGQNRSLMETASSVDALCTRLLNDNDYDRPW